MVTFQVNASDDGYIASENWRIVNWSSGAEVYNGSSPPTTLQPAMYKVHVVVRDDHGIWSDEGISPLIVHSRPVAMIDSITPSPAQDSDMVSFTGSGTDDGTVVMYIWTSSLDGEVYRGPDDTFSTDALSPGEHVITLVVIDDLNASSTGSDTTLTVINTDAQPPTITIESPENGITVEGDQEITGTASDDRMIASVQYRVSDGDPWKDAAGGANWTVTWNSSDVQDGRHTLQFRAFDGNQYSEPVNLEVIVDNEEETKDDDGSFLDSEIAGLPTPLVIGLLLILVIIIVMVVLTGSRKGGSSADEGTASDAPLTSSPTHMPSAAQPQIPTTTTSATPAPPDPQPAIKTTTVLPSQMPSQQPPVQPPSIPAPQTPPRPDPKPFESLGYWSCPRCGGAVEGKFFFCTSCGFKRTE
jgi:hypothetical protein